jgi:hypothetical protein
VRAFALTHSGISSSRAPSGVPCGSGILHLVLPVLFATWHCLLPHCLT